MRPLAQLQLRTRGLLTARVRTAFDSLGQVMGGPEVQLTSDGHHLSPRLDQARYQLDRSMETQELATEQADRVGSTDYLGRKGRAKGAWRETTGTELRTRDRLDRLSS